MDPSEENDDLFADLYGDDEPAKSESTKPTPAASFTAPSAPTETKPEPPVAQVQSVVPQKAVDPRQPQPPVQVTPVNKEPEVDDHTAAQAQYSWGAPAGSGANNNHGGYEEAGHHGNGNNGYGGGDLGTGSPAIKEDGKMFIGGLNWETTDESLKDYFSQFGEVVECTVMRDGPTGRSRGFGFLTFKDPKTVNIVMVKEHYLDGKIIDPKRAIPRDEQEKTSKIFVGGVSQEATETDFREYFTQFGRVLDATLMMDKDTGRPRGFGFVTFDSEAAVENALNHPNLEIMGKAIEVKKAQPRGKTFEDRDSGFRDRGHHNRNDNRDNFNNQQSQQNQMPPGAAAYNGLTPQLMAQYWQNMQRYMAAMQQQMGRGGPMPAFNPAMMNPAMMQQMQMQMQMMRAQQMQQGQPGSGGMSPQAAGQPGPGFQGGYPQQPQQQQQQAGYDGQQQQVPQQQGAGAFGQQQRGFQAHPSQRDYQAPQPHPSSWEGMYDDVPPHPMQQQQQQQQLQQQHGVGPIRTGTPTFNRGEGPPPNAPTGPKNARPGANFRGAGRGGPGAAGPRGGPQGFRGGGYHPYARSGGH